MNIAISGFGRIGRNFLRVLLQDKQALEKLKVVAINIGPANPHFIAHSFKYDTLLGIYPGFVDMEGDTLIIDDKRIKILTETDPEKLSWADLGIDWVVESSGFFTDKVGAQRHCKAGAKGVLISAPSKDPDAMVIMGVNEDTFDKSKDTIVSAGSCTTNALVPVLKVLDDTFGIESAYMTTVHSYTNNQVLLDVERSDVRRARAAALNIIPTTTGAIEVVGKVLPKLNGKIEGCSLRVPVAKVSLIDLAFVAEKPMTTESIHKAFQKAQDGTMAGVLALTDQPLVSVDFSQNDNSVIVDGLLTKVTKTLGKVFGWYDNEWAYSCRLKDFLVKCV
jgi:glyceraldehyde 3-phosphate dehydrogenase